MNIQDLRIGNLVLEFGEVTPIVQLDRGGKTFYRINDMQVHKQTFLTGGKVCFEPIPLTEEWLLKFGFKNIESNSFYLPRFSDYDIVLNENNAFLYREDMALNADIKYVHQLQNLYYALTGEELELQPS